MQTQFKNILVIGGTHGDEPIGIAIVEDLIMDRTEGIEGLIANPGAVAKNIRFIETDLNRSFGVVNPLTLEEQRAEQIKPYLKQADLIIEFHDTYAENNTCAIVTGSLNPLQQLLAEYFHMPRIVIMPLGGNLSGQNPAKTFSLEIARAEAELFSKDFFLTKIRSLNQKLAGEIKPQTVFECLPIKVLRATAQRLGLELNQLQNFEELSAEQVKKLELDQKETYVPMFIGEKAYGAEFGFQIGRKIS
jgi:hypothetical protein